MSMPSPGAKEEIRRDLQATLEARREIGPEFDDHLAASFLEKIEQHLNLQASKQRQPREGKLSSGQRLALGIVSLSLMVPAGIPILAIAGLSGLGILVAAIVLVNFFASL